MDTGEPGAPARTYTGRATGIDDESPDPLVHELRHVDKSAVLAPAQIDRFQSEGFLCLQGAIDPQELIQLGPIFDRLFAQRAGYSEGNLFDFAGNDDENPMFPQLLLPSRYEPALKQSKALRYCLAVASELLHGEAEFVFDHILVKPPGGPPTPWHQDQAFWGPDMKHRTITFWIPLQDVTVESGCLKFIPGSNRGPVLEHRSLDNDPSIHALEALNVPDESAVHCPLRAGDLTIHHWLTLHGADANSTAAARRAYAICLGVKGDAPLVAREYSWNRQKRTSRDIRYRASLTRWGRLKLEVRSRLTRMGLL